MEKKFLPGGRRVAAVLACGGASERMGRNKLLIPLGGVSVLRRSAEAVLGCGDVCSLIVAAPEALWERYRAELSGLRLKPEFVLSGRTRAESVRNAAAVAEGDIIMIHDGARPLVTQHEIAASVEDACRYGSSIICTPVKDTVRFDNGEKSVCPPRDRLFTVRTPQTFSLALYRFALEHAPGDFTDDAQLLDAIGVRPRLTPGEYTNIKLTTPDDVAEAEVILRRMSGERGLQGAGNGGAAGENCVAGNFGADKLSYQETFGAEIFLQRESPGTAKSRPEDVKSGVGSDLTDCAAGESCVDGNFAAKNFHERKDGDAEDFLKKESICAEEFQETARGLSEKRGGAENQYERRRFGMRIGQGYDVHRLAEGRRLVLGGVEIPHDKGLLGHSDADVLTHAIMDALLGAAALGDIGKLFPDTDERWRGANSLELLEIVCAKLREAGFEIGNIDATVVAQAPKLSPFIGEMRQNIASAAGLALSQVSVKATTEEWLGFTGKGEGIAAQAVAGVEER